jgi:hypothetical protein
MKNANDDNGRFIGKCECGGDVRGVAQFGRLWTWCTKCTPVVNVTLPPSRIDRGIAP